jgi:hypothetical protein
MLITSWYGWDGMSWEIARDAFELVMAFDVIFSNEDDLEQFTNDQREQLEEFSLEVWRPLSQLLHLP